MEDDTAVQKLIEILSAYYAESRPIEEYLTYSLTNEFLQNMRCVLLTKQVVSCNRWAPFFSVCSDKMQSTPEMYLRYIIYACRQYSRIHLNIFERFLSVFALLLHLRVVKLDGSAVNFAKLIPDVFMALYESELKKSFGRCGGFQRFVEYINNPKYLYSNYNKKDFPSYFDPNASVSTFTKDLNRQVDRMLSEEKELPEDFRLEQAETDRPSINMAQKILKSSKIEAPSFPSETDQKAKLGDCSQQMREQLAEKKILEVKQLHEVKKILKVEVRTQEVRFERCLDSDSETMDAVGRVTNNAQSEKIIDAVIRYNHSNSSGQEKANNPLLKEAYGILEHLEEKIKSCIGVLDEYDQE